MKTVYKYPIGLHIKKIEIYKNAKILSAGYDPSGILCVWALVDTEQEKEEVYFFSIGTGWDLPRCDLEFIDTVNDGPYMWHIFKANENFIHTYIENSKKEI